MTMEMPMVTSVWRRSWPSMRREDDHLENDAEHSDHDEGGGECKQPVAGTVGDFVADVAAKQIERAMRQIGRCA